MSVPGPSGAVLVLGLLGLAAAAAVVGEAVRLLVARWVASWRNLEIIERGLLDFFLGGAVFYLLAAVPVGAFGRPELVAVLLAGAGVVLVTALKASRRPSGSIVRLFERALRPGALLTLIAGLALLVLEVVVALPVGTGNTYDSSLLTFYTARLLDGHQLALSFQPSATVGILYPQGTTSWLGAAELLLGLPGARTSLLLTPLFFGLAPIGGFVLGRRLLGSDLSGLSFALVLTLLASWTRVLVGGSNDFVFAFPLVLWLAAQGVGWIRGVPTGGDAVAFGVLLGYSAALNPVGAEWLAPALLVAAALATPRFGASGLRWLARWSTAVGVALIPLMPSWWVVAHGLGNPALAPGVPVAPPGVGYGIDASQFVGAIDPYLFRSGDVWLSPLPVLRAELAVLLTVGLALLFLFGRSSLGSHLESAGAFIVGGVVATVGGLAIVWASSGGGILGRLAELTSVAELSIWLFTLYALIATLPLLVALERVVRTASPGGAGNPGRAPARPAHGRSASLARPRGPVAGIVALAVTLGIVLPGVALTPTQLPPVLTALYQDFGNVTSADFDLLSFAASHLPDGARVLVAPGSAGQFLPSYDPSAVLLYPMLPGWMWVNASYNLLLRELTNGTLDAAGTSALTSLAIQFVIVTQANTVLWRPFVATPLFSSSHSLVLFGEGDAYLFSWNDPGASPGAS